MKVLGLIICILFLCIAGFAVASIWLYAGAPILVSIFATLFIVLCCIIIGIVIVAVLSDKC